MGLFEKKEYFACLGINRDILSLENYSRLFNLYEKLSFKKKQFLEKEIDFMSKKLSEVENIDLWESFDWVLSKKDISWCGTIQANLIQKNKTSSSDQLNEAYDYLTSLGVIYGNDTIRKYINVDEKNIYSHVSKYLFAKYELRLQYDFKLVNFSAIVYQNINKAYLVSLIPPHKKESN